jgi:hypothetical protein
VIELVAKLHDLHAPIRVPGIGEYQYACGEAALEIERLRGQLEAAEQHVKILRAAEDAARLAWWFMNALHDSDDEASDELDYEARLCRTPDEFRRLIDANMGKR